MSEPGISLTPGHGCPMDKVNGIMMHLSTHNINI